MEINSDCLEVIDVMKEGGISFGPAAAIFEESSFLARGFAHVTFSYTPRKSNEVAHCLASLDYGPYSIVWHEDPPDCILGLLANDVALF